MPPNRRLIDSKWVFEKKSDGKFRARLVRGHTQITGVDFTYNYSLVVTDVKICVILLIWLINKWYYQTIDVETLFYINYYRNKYTRRYQKKCHKYLKKNTCTHIF